MCLKLGKRHYFEDATAASVVGKRGKPLYSTVPTSVPRCQVEGCHVALVNAKDYHRRHRVCEMHSKAPKVVVVGLEQRFCQQCSRCIADGTCSLSSVIEERIVGDLIGAIAEVERSAPRTDSGESRGHSGSAAESGERLALKPHKDGG